MLSSILNVNLSLSLTEIEAKEACTWLRAAGFPQYAQLYEGRTLFFPTSPVPDQSTLRYSCQLYLVNMHLFVRTIKIVVSVRDIA